MWYGESVVVVVGVNHGSHSLVGGKMMQQIESDEISDTGLGLIGNGVPERTLKFDFGESIFLGEDDDVVNTRRGVKCRW